jgi:hypothetical protein
MRQMIRILLGMLLLTSISAFATSFTNLSVNFNILPNDGSGSNMGGYITGPGVNLAAGGGTPFSWFNSIVGIAPGSSWGGGTVLFWDGAAGQLGSQVYNTFGNGGGLPYIQLDISTFNTGGFTFPTNGQDLFTIKVPASLGVITGTIVSDCNSCPTFSLTTLPGTLTLSFFYSSFWGQYFGGSGSFTSTPLTTVPEPGSLGLMLIGVAAVTRRRLQRRA